MGRVGGYQGAVGPETHVRIPDVQARGRGGHQALAVLALELRGGSALQREASVRELFGREVHCSGFRLQGSNMVNCTGWQQEILNGNLPYPSVVTESVANGVSIPIPGLTLKILSSCLVPNDAFQTHRLKR